MAVQAQFFPYLPIHTTWEEWNGNVTMYYGSQPIPHVAEDSWKDAANCMIALPIFDQFPLPDPKLYENWEDWANEFTLIINGQTI
jgi:hypothetical protein